MEKLVYVEKLTDAEIGERFGMLPTGVAYHRRAMGIEHPVRGTLDKPLPAARPMPTIIVDENGVTVTLCPPGFAHYFGLNQYTAKPRGRK